jgi:hypothetical protein
MSAGENGVKAAARQRFRRCDDLHVTRPVALGLTDCS